MNKIMFISGEIVSTLIALISMVLSFVLFYWFGIIELLWTNITDQYLPFGSIKNLINTRSWINVKAIYRIAKIPGHFRSGVKVGGHLHVPWDKNELLIIRLWFFISRIIIDMKSLVIPKLHLKIRFMLRDLHKFKVKFLTPDNLTRPN